MVNHLNRKSIAEALSKVFSCKQQNDAELKTELYHKILDVFDGTDPEVFITQNNEYSKAKIYANWL